MSKQTYKVRLTRSAQQSSDVIVEATDSDKAVEKAMDRAKEGKVRWRTDDNDYIHELLAVEEK